MPKLDGDVEITEKEIALALKEPDSFAMFGSRAKHADDFFKTWSLGPTIETRDSGLRERVNAIALKKHLKSDPSLKEEWYIFGASHWAVGHVDHIAFHAVDIVDGKKVPTRMFRVLKEWFDTLREYPIADEDLYEKMGREELLESIRSNGKRYVKDSAPKDWPETVYRWLDDGGEIELSDEPWVDEDKIRPALRELGLHTEDDDE